MDPFGLTFDILFFIMLGLAALSLIGYFYGIYRIAKLEDELRRIEEIRDWLEPNRDMRRRIK